MFLMGESSTCFSELEHTGFELGAQLRHCYVYRETLTHLVALGHFVRYVFLCCSATPFPKGR